MLRPAVIVFDLDGTLVDSRGDIVAATNHALTSTGRKPLAAQMVIQYVGDGARALCARAARLPEQSAEVDEITAAFTTYYVEHPLDFSRWMPGAQEVLDELGAMPGMTLALCTNKPREPSDAVLSALGIRTRFRAIVAGGDTPERKPAPGPLLSIAKQLEVEPQAVVMVGDGPQDVECARRAGARAVAVVGYGEPWRVADTHPDVLLDSLLELPDVVRRWVDSTARISVFKE